MLPALHPGAGNSDELPGEGDGVRVGPHRARVREVSSRGQIAAAGVDVVYVLQRPQDGIRDAARLHRDRPSHPNPGAGRVDGRGRAAHAERGLRGRAHVHARALRARHRVRR